MEKVSEFIHKIQENSNKKWKFCGKKNYLMVYQS